MKNEDRIVELLAEMVIKQDQMIEEIKLVKNEVGNVKSEVSGVKGEIIKLIYKQRKIVEQL